MANSSSQPPTTPQFSFTGQRFERSVGTYNYGASWYDPAIGRFLQADSMVPDPVDPQSLNRYAYTRNNPVSRLDPSAHSDFNWNLWDEGSSDEPDWETFSANVETFTYLTWFVDPSFSYTLALLNGAGISASARTPMTFSAGSNQPASLGAQLAGLGAGLAVGTAFGSISGWALGEVAAAIACTACAAAVAGVVVFYGGYQI